jgi:lipopolysaccharide transport system permease protein
MSAIRLHETVIRPPAELVHLDVREYYRYRHMILALVKRNVRLQFQDLTLGFLWVCARPLLYVLVFVSFRRLSGANVYVDIPYPLYVYSGLILWYYFVETTTEAAGALRADAHMMTKVYYPRLISPLVPVLANTFAFGLSAMPLLVMMAWYGVGPGWRLLMLPFVLVQSMALIVGIGAGVASMTLRNRDGERLLGFLLYAGLFVSPVIYAVEMIPESFRVLYALNPAIGMLVAFRSTLFEPVPFPVWQWGYASVFTAVVLSAGVAMFRRAESRFADEL